MKRLGTVLASAAAALGVMASLAAAQDGKSAEQLQRELDEANVQLRAAQDRKNELATENQKLQKRAAEQEQQLQQVREELETLQHRAYFLREHYAAWRDFLDLNPPIKAMWSGFFSPVMTPTSVTDLLGDGNWPFSVSG